MYKIYKCTKSEEMGDKKLYSGISPSNTAIKITLLVLKCFKLNTRNGESQQIQEIVHGINLLRACREPADLRSGTFYKDPQACYNLIDFKDK